MRWRVDLNVLLDVLQARRPFSDASSTVLSRAFRGEAEGCLAAHTLTTLFYLVAKHRSPDVAGQTIDWALDHFHIVPQDEALFRQARILSFDDFEDAAVSVAAEVAECDWIVTRNVRDFDGSSVPAVTPEELNARLSEG